MQKGKRTWSRTCEREEPIAAFQYWTVDAAQFLLTGLWQHPEAMLNDPISAAWIDECFRGIGKILRGHCNRNAKATGRNLDGWRHHPTMSSTQLHFALRIAHTGSYARCKQEPQRQWANPSQQHDNDNHSSIEIRKLYRVATRQTDGAKGARDFKTDVEELAVKQCGQPKDTDKHKFLQPIRPVGRALPR